MPSPYEQQLLDLQNQNKTLTEKMQQQDLLRAQRPEDYNYTSQIDPSTGMLKSQYQMQGGDVFNQLKQQASGAGPSTWANMMLQNQQTAQQGALGQAQGQSLQAQANARNQLAMRGGLGGGSRLALARGGQQDLMNAQQGIASQGLAQRGNILANDVQQKQDLLKGLAGGEQQMQQFNISNALKEQGNIEAAKQQTYGKKMEEWGAERQAQATEKSKGK